MSFIFKLYINYNELIVFSIPAFGTISTSKTIRESPIIP